jgi:DNA-binding protein H-NS
MASASVEKRVDEQSRREDAMSRLAKRYNFNSASLVNAPTPVLEHIVDVCDKHSTNGLGGTDDMARNRRYGEDDVAEAIDELSSVLAEADPEQLQQVIAAAKEIMGQAGEEEDTDGANEMAEADEYCQKFSEQFNRLGTTKAELMSGFKIARRRNPSTTAKKYFSIG